ncbi:MAG: Na+/H+ antiporter subunit E [Actinomycetia bacterium]|nr:Na+/H+ antiporter subunit E [Actinomycetes bacterium]
MSGAMRGAKRRVGAHVPIALGLTVVWVLLWGEVNAFNVIGGLLVAFAVLLFFPLPPIQQPVRLRPLGLTRLVTKFGLDVVVASVHVAVVALRVGYRPMNAVIEVPLRARSDLFLTFTAELVSLVPGSLLIEVDQERNVIFLHIFDVHDDADVERAREAALAQERRVVEALASEADLAAYRRAVKEERS